MRRAPNENTQSTSTNVFSDEAWSNSTPTSTYSTIETQDTVDLSKYAATALPDTFSSSSRAPRYTPSPHSSQYEPSPNQTNSGGNPFDHAAYDGRPASPLPQNARYDDMPSSMRKRKLGGPVQGLVSDQNTAYIQSQQVAPQAPQAPQAYNPAPSKTAQVEQNDSAYRPAPQVQTFYAAPLQEQDLPEQPITPQTPPAPQQTTIRQTPPLDQTVENEVPISDFEKDFIAEQIESPIEENVIDLTLDTLEIKAEPIRPSLFNTGPVAFSPEQIAYNTNDAIFGTQHLDIPDSDRLYKDERPSRDTFQIDLELFKNLFSKISIKVIVITLVAVLLLVAAYVVVKPASSSNENIPANSSESSLTGSEKTVVPSSDPGLQAPDPSVTLPQSATGDPVYVDPSGDPNIYPQQGGGAVVTYDENGNAVYSSPTNQNFNGD